MSIFHNINARRKFNEMVELVQTCLRPLDVKNKPAFSMMEMLIVMLVVSVVMAMHAPTVVKKKLETDRVTYEVWTPVTDGGDIAWNISGKTISAIIGGEKAKIDEIVAKSSSKPGMIISSPDRNEDDAMVPQIGVLKIVGGSPYTGLLRLNKSVPLNNSSTSSIAIGTNIAALPSNSIALGANIKDVKSANSVMIGPAITMKGLGNDGKTLTANNVSIGYGTYIKSSDSIAIGKGLAVGAQGQVQDYDAAHRWIGPRVNNADKSIVIGNSKVFGGNGTVAIGENITVHASSSAGNIVALGSNSDVLVSDATVNIGEQVSAANKSVAIGYKANSRGIESVAIGNSANVISLNERGYSAADYTVAIGNNVKAEAPTKYSVVIGEQAVAGVANHMVVIGKSAKASAINAISIGNGANVTVAADAIAMGDGAQAHKANAISVFGNANVADGIAIGYGVGEVNKDDSFAIGSNANVTVANWFAVGSSAKATAVGAIPIGYGVNIGNTHAIGIGYKAEPQGSGAVIVGNQARGRGVAIGSNSSAASSYAVAIGQDSIASVAETVALGHTAKASASNTIAVGKNSTASVAGAIAIGNRASSSGGVAIGYDTSTSSGLNIRNKIYRENVNGSWRTVVGTSSSNIYGLTDKQIENLHANHRLIVDKVYVGRNLTTGSLTASTLILYVTGDGSYTIEKKGFDVTTETQREVGSRSGALVNFETDEEMMDNDFDGRGDGGGGGSNSGSSTVSPQRPTPTPAPTPTPTPGGSSGSTSGPKPPQTEDLTPEEPPSEPVIPTVPEPEPEPEPPSEPEIPPESEVLQTEDITPTYETVYTTETFQRAYYKRYYSDARLKNLAGESTVGMVDISKLKVYDYKYKATPKVNHVGVMAQHLKKIFPNAVVKDIKGYLQIRQEDMFFAMVNALKELDAKIKKIAIDMAQNIKMVTSNEAKIKARDVEIQELKEEIALIRKAVEKLPQKK